MGKKKDAEDRIEHLKKNLRVAESKGRFNELAGLHNQLGYELRMLGIYDEAIEHHKEEAKRCKEFNKGEKMGVGIAYRNIGEVYLDMKEVNKGVKYTKMYLDEAKKHQDLKEEQRAHITLGRMYVGLADSDDCPNEFEKQIYLDKAEKEFMMGMTILNDEAFKKHDIGEIREMKSGACLNLGFVYDLKDDYKRSKTWLEKAISYATEGKLYDLLYKSYFNLYGLHLKQDKLEEAKDAIQRTVKIAKLLKNSSDEIEAKFSEAKVYLLMNEIDHAKRILKKLRKRIKAKNINSYLLEDLDPLLTSVLKIIKAEDELNTMALDNHKRKKELNEILGDSYVNIGCFNEAIIKYKLCIEHANRLNLTPKEISKFYYSIAETYKDKSDWTKALQYFELEMALEKDDPNDAFRTQTNIAIVLEKYNVADSTRIKSAYEEAIELAKKCSSPKKVVLAYNNLALYCKLAHQTEEAEKYLKIVEDMKKEHGIKDLETMEDSQDLLDDGGDEDLNLSDLSSESGSDNDEDINLSFNKNEASCKNQWKKNDKGEYPLHVSAQKGDLKSVIRLIKRGHPVNVRDSAGWTPLHEAANFGHLDVILELIKHKAKINDRGGEYSDGITPLLDASSNGHMSIMKALIEAGARTIDKDKEGNYPIDLLIMWWGKQDSSTKADNESEYAIMKTYLISKMKKAGVDYKEGSRRLKSRKESSASHSLIKKSYRGGIEDLIPVRITTADEGYDPDDPKKAINDYAKTMGLLRGNKGGREGINRRTRGASPPQPPPSISALLPESQNVVDDWLENDIIDFNHKRKRDPLEDIRIHDEITYKRREGRRNDLAVFDVASDNSSRFSKRLSFEETGGDGGSGRKKDDQDSQDIMDDIENYLIPDETLPETLQDNISQSPPLPRRRRISSDSSNSSKSVEFVRRKSQEEKRTISRKSSSMSLQSAASSHIVDPSDSDPDSPIRPKKVRRLIQSRLPVTVISKGRNRISPRVEESSSEEVVVAEPRIIENKKKRSSSTNQLILRLKVRIGDKALLVPVTEDQMDNTIEWLCKACSDRYFESHKVRVNLTLSTTDGAEFSGNDSIRLVLKENDELLGSITSYDLKPLSERYQTACNAKSSKPNEEIILSLNHCQSSNVLLMQDFSLRNENSLFQALQFQHSLRELSLSGCSLFDEGVKNLCQILHTLPGLLILDLNCNGITCAGFQEFALLLQRKAEDSIPLGLATINFSHNPLGNSIGKNLMEILTRLTQLRRICLVDCNLGVRLFSQIKAELVNALNISRLEELDLSLNNWNECEVESFVSELHQNLRRNAKFSYHGVNNEDDEEILDY